MITDLDVATVDRESASMFVAEFLVWWVQAGRNFYGKSRGEDDGIRTFANYAVDAVGGWAHARRLIRACA